MDPTGVLVIVVRVDQCLEIQDAEADWICVEWGVLMPVHLRVPSGEESLKRE